MANIQIEGGRSRFYLGPEISFLERFRRIFAAAPAENRAETWHRLNDRLLRDIGKSPADAEVARLRARYGVADDVEIQRLRCR